MTPKQISPISIVPFTREKTGHITVVARLSGKPARFLVDTGAGGTCIHSGLLEKYKLATASKSKKGGGVGTSTMKLMIVSSHDLSVEGIDLSPFKLIALDLSHVVSGLAKAKVDGVVGVIGADILYRRRAIIDYARSILLLSR